MQKTFNPLRKKKDLTVEAYNNESQNGLMQTTSILWILQPDDNHCPSTLAAYNYV